jgi:hypothetical protein
MFDFATSAMEGRDCEGGGRPLFDHLTGRLLLHRAGPLPSRYPLEKGDNFLPFCRGIFTGDQVSITFPYYSAALSQILLDTVRDLLPTAVTVADGILIPGDPDHNPCPPSFPSVYFDPRTGKLDRLREEVSDPAQSDSRQSLVAVTQLRIYIPDVSFKPPKYHSLPE